MNLNTWYDKGLTKKEYMDLLDDLRDGFMEVYNNFKLPNDEAFISSLKERKLRVIVLAEVWCGHCMFDIPILLHLAEATSMPVRFLLRDDNLELMDQHLTNGKSRTIPIMLFIDEDGNQVAKWGPIAPEVKAFVQDLSKDLPEKDDPSFKDKQQEMYKALSIKFQEESTWDAVYNDIKKALT